MPFKKFDNNDIFHNVIKTYPRVRFDIYDARLYYQNRSRLSGTFVDSTPNVDTGFISLYEMNVDRSSGGTGLIYPFVTKGGSLTKFRTISTSEFNNSQTFAFGDIITGSYPMSSSIVREHVDTPSRPHVAALKNTLNYYTKGVIKPNF